MEAGLAENPNTLSRHIQKDQDRRHGTGRAEFTSMFSKTALKYRVDGLFPGRTKVRSFFPLDADADRWREQTLAAIVVMAQR